MDNLKNIKKAIITWIAPFVAESNEYKNIDIGADFSDEKMNIPSIIVDIDNIKELTDKKSGLYGYDFVTEEQAIVYITEYLIAIKCHANLQEESSDIASYIKGKIRRANTLPYCDGIKIVRIQDSIAMGIPKLVDSGASKHWICPINFIIRTNNTIMTDPGMIYKES
jgi:hypothetical protein